MIDRFLDFFSTSGFGLRRYRARFYLLEALTFGLVVNAVSAQETLQMVTQNEAIEQVREVPKKMRALMEFNKLEEAYALVQQYEEDTALAHNLSFHIEAGNTCFFKGRFFQSIHYYREAFGFAWGVSEEDSLYNANLLLLNLGSAYSRLNLLDSALAAYERVQINDKNRYLLINNIAQVYMSKHEYRSALKYLAQIDLDDVEDLRFGFIARLNSMKCYDQLEMLEEAQAMFTPLFYTNVEYSDTANQYDILIDHLIIQRDKPGFMNFYEMNESYLERMKNKNSTFMRASQLYSTMLAETKYLDESWELFRSSLLSTSKEEPGRLSDWLAWKMMNPRQKLFWVLTMVGLVAFIVVLALYIQQSALRRKFLLVNPYGSSGTGSKGTIHLKDSDPLDEQFIKELTPAEVQVIKLLFQGIHTKEMASQMQISVGHAYNLRSSIRRKYMQLYPEQDFEAWLKGNIYQNQE